MSTSICIRCILCTKSGRFQQYFEDYGITEGSKIVTMTCTHAHLHGPATNDSEADYGDFFDLKRVCSNDLVSVWLSCNESHHSTDPSIC